MLTAHMPTAVTVFLLASTAALPAQQARSGEFSIAGTVVDKATAAPLSRALVRIAQMDTDLMRSQSVLTDASGAFRFSHLAEGAWQVNAQRPGFQDAEFQPETSLVTVGPASREDLWISLQPGTTIVGRVTDTDGTG